MDKLRNSARKKICTEIQHKEKEQDTFNQYLKKETLKNDQMTEGYQMTRYQYMKMGARKPLANRSNIESYPKPY